jgi:hypothetical protein
MLSRDATFEEFQAVVFSGNDEILRQFQDQFGAEIDRACRSLHGAYSAFRHLEDVSPKTRRASAVQIFAFHALDGIVSSTALLIRGSTVSSGNLMRHFTEGVAVALLFSHSHIESFNLWMASPQTFPFDSAPQILLRRRNRELLKLDHKAWQAYVRLARWYSSLSHASNAAIGANLLFSSSHVALSGGFDPAKGDYYRAELTRRASGAESLRNILHVLCQRASDFN